MRRCCTASAAATCITVGNESLLLCPRFAWSFGCTGERLPRGWPSASLARLAMTSLAFMLVWVPDPVCQTGRGNSASIWPAAMAAAAAAMGWATSGGSSPRASLASALACFCRPTARISTGGKRSWPMRNSRRARSVCGPQ